MLVTCVEAYLHDVLSTTASVDPKLMSKSEQPVYYTDVIGAGSLDELANELRARWARGWLDDGAPTRWLSRLHAMGARGYPDDLAPRLERIWGIRHVVVHAAGVADADFVKRHPVRYRLKLASWTVVRERGQPSPRILEDSAAVALLAGDLLKDTDDDREHFWGDLPHQRQKPLSPREPGERRHAVGRALPSARGNWPCPAPGRRASIILIHNHPTGPHPIAGGRPAHAPDRRGCSHRRYQTPRHVVIADGTEPWLSFAGRGLA
jgi:hypothetical protein